MTLSLTCAMQVRLANIPESVAPQVLRQGKESRPPYPLICGLPAE